MLRKGAPEIRTIKDLVEKHEQIFDALEHEAISPKVAEQMNQSLKGITGAARLELQYWSLVAQFGQKAPVPRSPLLRSAVGLPADVSSTDGEFVRQVLKK